MKWASEKSGAALIACALVLAILLHGCATGSRQRPPSETFALGQQLLAQGRIEEGIALLEQAVKEDPKRFEYQVYLANQREAILGALASQADRERAAGNYANAEALYQQMLRLDPGSPRAKTGLAQIPIDQKHDLLIAEADAALAKGDTIAAEARLRQLLQENPQHARGRALAHKVMVAQSASLTALPELKRALRKPITLEFRDADLGAVFEVMSRAAGINFVLDREVQANTKVNIFVRNTPIEDVLKILLLTNQLERKVLNDNSVLVFPNTPAKQREYQDLVVRNFYLTNADAKQTQAMLKSVMKAKDIYIDEKLNLLVLRDTPDAIRVAERLVAAQDLAEPEVVLDLEVLEVARTKLQELGFKYPTQVQFGNALSLGTGAPALVPLNSGLRAFISNPAIVAALKQEVGSTNLLANPRVRVKNRDKAKVLIGQKLPVFTTTSTANVGVSTNVSYLDVGLKLEIEPQVYLDDEVAMKVNLEVSSVIRERSSGGTQPAIAYELGTRTATTTLRLKDGDTQALAGLIQDEDRRLHNNVPGLVNIPVLGRLFSNQSSDIRKTEIVLLITPHVVRNLQRPAFQVSEFVSGTEAAATTMPLRLKPTAPGALSLAPSAVGQEAVTDALREMAPDTFAPPPSGAVAGAAEVALELRAPGEASLGKEFSVNVGMPGGAAQSAQFEIAFDPGALEIAEAGGAQGIVVASGPGRAVLRLEAAQPGQAAGGSVRFRVVAKAPTSTELRVENVVVQDPQGVALPSQAPGPYSLTLVR